MAESFVRCCGCMLAQGRGRKSSHLQCSRLRCRPIHVLLRPLLTPQVYGLPTIVLVRNGEKVSGSHHEGAITQAKLVAYLEKHGFTQEE